MTSLFDRKYDLENVFCWLKHERDSQLFFCGEVGAVYLDLLGVGFSVRVGFFRVIKTGLKKWVHIMYVGVFPLCFR